MSETLVIVTSDHASAITFSGFNTPQNYSVLGMDKFLSDVDRKSYQLLMYASGPGNENYNETLTRRDPQNAYHKATIPLIWGNHDATDVPLFAQGPLANVLFSGSIDQTYVAHAIAFAMCLFQYESRCERYETEPPHRYSKIHELRQEFDRLFAKQTSTTTTVSISSSTIEEHDSTTDQASNEISDEYFEPSTENDDEIHTEHSSAAVSSSSIPLSEDVEVAPDISLSTNYGAKVYLTGEEVSLAISSSSSFERMYYLLSVCCALIFFSFNR